MRQPNPEFQQRMAEMAREGQRLHEEKEGLRRQLAQMGTEGAGVTAQHEQQLRALKGHAEQLRLQLDQEKRAATDRSEQDRVQHQRDLDAARKEKEQVGDESRRRCTELEAQIAKLQLERDRDHEATVEAQRLAREQESRGGKLADEAKRRDDLIAMHEREGREKQERVDDGLKRTAALQVTIVELEQKAKSTGAELDQKSREVETLRKDNASLMANLKSEQRNCEKWYGDFEGIMLERGRGVPQPRPHAGGAHTQRRGHLCICPSSARTCRLLTGDCNRCPMQRPGPRDTPTSGASSGPRRSRSAASTSMVLRPGSRRTWTRRSTA